MGQGPFILEALRSHSFRQTTVGRTPLDESSARRRDLYLTTHNTHNRQTSMPPAGFESTIPPSERPQTHALDRAATGTGRKNITIGKRDNSLNCNHPHTPTNAHNLRVIDRPPDYIPALMQWWGLFGRRILRVMPAVAYLLARSPMSNKWKVMTQTKRDILVPQVWDWAWDQAQPVKKFTSRNPQRCIGWDWQKECV